MQGKYFQVISGDIFDVGADVMAFSANPYPHPSLAGLDLEVYQRAGFYKVISARETSGRLEYGGLAVTSGFGLPFRWLFHIVTPMYMGDSYNEETLLGECYKTCLKKAVQLGARSIVFPLLGAGALCFEEIKAFEIAAEAINSMGAALRGLKVFIAIKGSELATDLDRVENFTEEYVQKQMAAWRAEGDLAPEYEGEVLQMGEEIRLHNDLIRAEIEKDRAKRQIYREIREEKELFLSGDPSATERQFAHKKIFEFIAAWCRNTEKPYTGKKYQRREWTPNDLARAAGLSSSTLAKIMAAGTEYVATRETLIALGVAMKLNKSDRLRLILYGNEDKRYPISLKEKLLEELLDSYREIPEFTVVDSDLNRRSEGEYSILPQRRTDTARKKGKEKASR